MRTANGTHRREHRSLLAAAERRLLTDIARGVPLAVTSDHLTGLALAAMAAVGTGFALMRVTPWGAIVVVAALAVNWFGDSLDGTLARVRGHERPRFGYYVDHVVDLAGIVMLFSGLAWSGLMSPVLAFAVLAGYLLVSAEVYLATHAGGVFRMSYAGIGPTELRILLAAGALYAAIGHVVLLPGFKALPLFDVGGAVALAGFLAAFVTGALRQTRALYRLEPIPPTNAGHSRSITELTTTP